MIVIVGAGLAGLTCAKVLHEQRQPFVLLEASDAPGGRVRTDVSPSGFRLDRGFQVLFTAYPAARRHLSFGRLALRRFDPGALIALNGRLQTLSDPRREPDALFPSLFASAVTLGDKTRVLKLRRAIAKMSLERIFDRAAPDETIEQYLTDFGFSRKFVDNFIRPFYGGIFLDRSLETSAAMFKFTFKMLSAGDTVVPAEGIGAITDQLARLLPITAVRYNTTVADLLSDGHRALGVRTDDGVVYEADAVVMATDPPTTARLTGVPMPTTPVMTTCVYFSSPKPLYNGKKIVLNAAPDAFVNNLVQITNIAPSYAPAGQHLLSATLLELPQGREDDIAARALDDVKRLFPRRNLSSFTPLSVVRVPFAQYAQPPGFLASAPANETGLAGLIVASEATESSSIQGAMLSGQYAADAARRALDTGQLTPA